VQPSSDVRPYSLALAEPTAARRADDRRVGHAAMKSAVAREAGVATRHVRVRHRPGAAPHVALRHERGRSRPRIAVSLSHRDGRAAAVASTSVAAIGVDLEKAAAVEPAQARYFLAPSEQRLLTWYSASELWALKEAAWKALGLGDAVAFSSLTLDVSVDGAVTALVLHGIRMTARAILDHPAPGWVLAVLWLPQETA
jgi:phosphopantetheinyl transferase (holo-ACP synthase)